MSATLTPPEVADDEQWLVLPAIQWWQYETIVQTLSKQTGLKITYIDGILTLLSPSRRHDWHEKSLGYLIAAVATGLKIAWEPAGHATYRRESQRGGVAGDDAYHFGANAERMRGPVNVDLSTQPPPDLAIEIEATHRADDSVAVWGRLGVPEVWRLDLNRGALSFGVRQSDGSYAPAPCSVGLAPLEPDDVLEQLKKAEQLGYSRWYAQLDRWVHDVLVPRRDAASHQPGRVE